MRTIQQFVIYLFFPKRRGDVTLIGCKESLTKNKTRPSNNSSIEIYKENIHIRAEGDIVSSSVVPEVTEMSWLVCPVPAFKLLHPNRSSSTMQTEFTAISGTTGEKNTWHGLSQEKLKWSKLLCLKNTECVMKWTPTSHDCPDGADKVH